MRRTGPCTCWPRMPTAASWSGFLPQCTPERGPPFTGGGGGEVGNFVDRIVAAMLVEVGDSVGASDVATTGAMPVTGRIEGEVILPHRVARDVRSSGIQIPALEHRQLVQVVIGVVFVLSRTGHQVVSEQPIAVPIEPVLDAIQGSTGTGDQPALVTDSAGDGARLCRRDPPQ